MTVFARCGNLPLRPPCVERYFVHHERDNGCKRGKVQVVRSHHCFSQVVFEDRPDKGTGRDTMNDIAPDRRLRMLRNAYCVGWLNTHSSSYETVFINVSYRAFLLFIVRHW